jgi:hypothetical protein
MPGERWSWCYAGEEDRPVPAAEPHLRDLASTPGIRKEY